MCAACRRRAMPQLVADRAGGTKDATEPKWVMLATAGGITCLLRGSLGEIEAVPGGTALALRFLAETASVAAASGYAPRAAFTARAQGMLTAKGSSFVPSMYRDMQGNALVEVDQILSDMVDRARLLNLATPLLEAAVAQLRVYQNRILAAASGTPGLSAAKCQLSYRGRATRMSLRIP